MPPAWAPPALSSPLLSTLEGNRPSHPPPAPPVPCFFFTPAFLGAVESESKVCSPASTAHEVGRAAVRRPRAHRARLDLGISSRLPRPSARPPRLPDPPPAPRHMLEARMPRGRVTGSRRLLLRWGGPQPCLGSDSLVARAVLAVQGLGRVRSVPFPCKAAPSGDMGHWMESQEILFKAVCPLQKELSALPQTCCAFAPPPSNCWFLSDCPLRTELRHVCLLPSRASRQGLLAEHPLSAPILTVSPAFPLHLQLLHVDSCRAGDSRKSKLRLIDI